MSLRRAYGAPAFPNGRAVAHGPDAYLRARRREVAQLEGMASHSDTRYPGIDADLADAQSRLAEAEAG